MHTLLLLIASIATMRAAIEKGDIDEAARQGVLAGPAVVERALAAPDRASRLAAIAAAPSVEDRAELLDALARAAAGPDRRVALPAARAARTIALELSQHDRDDDIAADDLIAWRDTWAQLAARADRWIELRVIALDVAAYLDRAAANDGIGLPLDTALADRDPAFRRAAIELVISPVPAAMRPAIDKALATDTNNDVALAAAKLLCFESADAIDAAGRDRIRALGVKRCGK